MEVLCNLDQYLFQFVEGSGMTIMAVLGALKAIAACTPSVTDDKIVSLLSGMVTSIKPIKK